MTAVLPTRILFTYSKLFQIETLTNRSVSRQHAPFCKMVHADGFVLLNAVSKYGIDVARIVSGIGDEVTRSGNKS